ncbi:MAG: bifunctional nuclease family protein [Deltaproteobacteria bacterium]|nr:bifunctional nuclease family protein [Deltaproteobacteria bacterium]
MKRICTLAALAVACIIWNVPFASLMPLQWEGRGISLAAPLEKRVASPPDAGPWGDIHLIRASFFRLRIDSRTDQPVVELLNDEGDRLLRIWIGLNEAIAIQMETKKIVPPRPMTHDLIANILKDLGARVNKVIIHDLRDNTFYAYISLNLKGEDHAVDSRPSDAIALSLRAAAPIYVAEKIFAKYGIEVTENDLISGLRVLLGADVQGITPDLAASFGLKETGGVLIADVQPKGKADEGGLRRGDVILEVEDESVTGPAQLAARIRAQAGKGPLRLKVLRKGKALELTLKP